MAPWTYSHSCIKVFIELFQCFLCASPEMPFINHITPRDDFPEEIVRGRWFRNLETVDFNIGKWADFLPAGISEPVRRKQNGMFYYT